MSARAVAAWWIVALLVVAFLVSTLFTAGHHRSASEVVNAGCAAHGGVQSWGGDTATDATCRDGYAFQGDDTYWTEPWWWPNP